MQPVRVKVHSAIVFLFQETFIVLYWIGIWSFVDPNGYRDVPYRLEAKADAKFDCVAAASIVAKVYRDTTIEVLCRECELADAYGWRSNMGYPTRQHLLALKEHGLFSGQYFIFFFRLLSKIQCILFGV